MEKVKIIATLGPASSQISTLRKMCQAGLNVARLNFSHGSFATHIKLSQAIKRINKTSSIALKILQDLEGYRIRIGRLQKKRIVLKKGAKFFLAPGKKQQRENEIPFDYEGDLSLIKTGQLVYIDDGHVELRVEKAKRNRLEVKVLRGEFISERKGVNLPGAELEFSALSQKDKSALAVGLEIGVDFVAQSFVRSAADVYEIKEEIAKFGKKKKPKVIAKIENRKAVAAIDEIIDAADMIMVARGDMGICLPIFMVPIIQKEIIAKCRKKKKPVIVATQMLESMRSNPLPLRAEVSDVANAILDGADFLMLSAETAVGKYPIETVEMMKKIIDFTQHSVYYQQHRWPKL